MVPGNRINDIISVVGLMLSLGLTVWVKPEPTIGSFLFILLALLSGWWFSGDRPKQISPLLIRVLFIFLLSGGAATAADQFPHRWKGIVFVVFVTAWSGFRGFRKGAPAVSFLILALGLTAAPMTELNLERDPWTILATAVFAVLSLSNMRKDSVREYKIPGAVYILGIFVIWIFVGMFFSVYPYATWHYGWMWSFDLLVFIFAVIILQKESLRRLLSEYFIILSAVYALDALIIGVERIFYMGWLRGLTFRIFVFHRHPTYTIFLLALTLPLIVSYFRKDGAKRVFAAVVIGLVLFYLIVYSYSREGWLLLFIYFISGLWMNRHHLKLKQVFVISAGLAVLSGIGLLGFRSIFYRVESMLHVSTSLRGQAWRVFWALHKDRPWFGFGMGTDRYIYPQAWGAFHPLASPTRQFLYEAHNAFIEILVGSGWIGLFLFLIFLFYITGPYVKRQSGMGLYYRLVAVGIWIDLFFNYRFHAQDTNYFLVVFLAVLTAYITSSQTASGGIIVFRNRYAHVLAGIAVCLVCVFSSFPWFGRFYVSQAQQAVSRRNWAEAGQYFSKASLLEPLNAHPHYYLAQWEIRMNRPQRGLLELSNAVKLCPNYAFYRYQMTLSELQNGRINEALEQISIAKTLEPFSPDGDIRLLSGIINWNLGNKTEAQKDLYYAVLKKPSLLDHPFMKENWGLKVKILGDFGAFARAVLTNDAFVDNYQWFIAPSLHVLDRSGLDEISEQLWYEALKKFPYDETLIISAVKHFILKGAWEESEGLLIKGIENLPDSFNLYNLLGYVYFKLNKLPEAKDAFETAEKKWSHISLDNLFGYRFLAEIYRGTGQKDELRQMKKRISYLEGGRFKREKRDLAIHFGKRDVELQLLSLIQ